MPDCVAGARGFELTHSRSNPVSAWVRENLGILERGHRHHEWRIRLQKENRSSNLYSEVPFTSFRGKQLQVSQARPSIVDLNLHGRDARATQALPPGRIRVLDQRLMADCGQDTILELLELQPEGKRRISAAEFINGYRPQAGEQLGS